MVAPPFFPKCITPKYLAPGKEEEANPTTIIGMLLLSYMVDTLPHYFLTAMYGAPTDLKSTRNVV